MTELSRRRFLLTSLLGSSTLAGLGRLGSVRPVAAEAVPEELVTGVDRETVVALMSRIIPKGGEGDSPGALEANCVGFLAALLADVENPFRDVYRTGLEGVAAVCDVRFAKSFVELAAKTQDEVLRLIEAGDAEGWPSEGVGPADFFEALRTHTIWGFLADPKYGGNRYYNGWRAAGYPGPGHGKGVRPKQLSGEEEILPIWDPRY